MKKPKKQSIVIAVLAVALVVVGGIAAIAIYNNRQNSDEEDQASVSETDKNKNASSGEKEKPERAVADWAVLTTDRYSTPIPDGWKLQNSITDFENTPENDKYNSVTEVTLMKHSDLQYRAGTPATVEEVRTTGRAGTEPENSLLRMGYSDDVLGKIDEFKQNSDDSTEVTTEDGHTMYASVNTYEKDTPTIMMKIKAGTHYYTIVVKERSSKSGVIIRYMVEPEMTDYSAQFQKALKHLKFL